MIEWGKVVHDPESRTDLQKSIEPKGYTIGRNWDRHGDAILTSFFHVPGFALDFIGEERGLPRQSNMRQKEAGAKLRRLCEEHAARTTPQA